MASFDKFIIPKINRYHKAPLKTVKESDEFILKKSKYNNLNWSNRLNSEPKDSFNLSLNNYNNNVKTRDKIIKLPIIDTKNISTYSKMKQYKVLLPKHRDKKEISYEEQEEKVQNFLNKYAKANIKSNKYLIEDDDVSKKYDFDSYLKLQSAAEIKFKPRFGDSSNLLVNYIQKVSDIRKKIVDDVLDDIKRNTENRYNLEKPNIDFNFRSKDKNLIDNRWKNTYSLDEYQRYFIKNLRGKISDMSYLNMVKKFQKISLICFSEGNLNRNAIKRLDSVNS